MDRAVPPTSRGGRGRRHLTPAEVREHQLARQRAAQTRRERIGAIRDREIARRRQANRQGSALLSGIVAAAGLVLVIFVLSQLGFSLPSFPSNDTSVNAGPNDAGPLPSVSIAGASPCEYNSSPRINLTTPARLQACKDAKAYAKQMLVQKFGDAGGAVQFQCLDGLWTDESAWSAWAINLDSGAAGIAQALGHGHVYNEGDWQAQVNWGLLYIYGRPDYGAPCKARALWLSRNPHWY